MNKNIRNFLLIGKIEGYSYILLLFIAMPMKYFMNIPEPVKFIGMLHGILFVAFMLCIVMIIAGRQFSLLQGIQAFLLSLLPFGTFYLKDLTESKVSLKVWLGLTVLLIVWLFIVIKGSQLL